MIQFCSCIKYQYHDTNFYMVSISISWYNLKVSYPTLDVCDDKQAWMPEGSVFRTDGAATLKLWKAGCVDPRNRQQAGIEGGAQRACRNMITTKRAQVYESVWQVSRWMGAMSKNENVTSNNPSECILDVLKPADAFLCGICNNANLVIQGYHLYILFSLLWWPFHWG